jgi:hypothetical protein
VIDLRIVGPRVEQGTGVLALGGLWDFDGPRARRGCQFRFDHPEEVLDVTEKIIRRCAESMSVEPDQIYVTRAA